MARQNRVTPYGELIATPARGALMGNRGRLHDEHGMIKRNYQGERWIICLLNFKDRRRSVMAPGQYTELFFLDEATALAAGHRPCAECQRERFDLFRQTWARANPELALAAKPSASSIDAVLHRERLAGSKRKATYLALAAELPAGTFITLGSNGDAFLIWQGRLLHWTPFGYDAAVIEHPSAAVPVLTPPSVVRALAAGYPVQVHGSAAGLVP